MSEHPIVDRLSDPTDEAALARMWRRIDDRRSTASRPPWRWLAVAAVAAGVLAFVVSRRPTSGPELGVPVVASFSFDDGARIEIDDDARLVPVVHDNDEVGLVLERGRATFDIPPGLGRRWWIDAGRTTVEVVGTRFDVVRDRDRVTVTVVRGAVLVRSELLADRVRRIAAGEHIVVARTEPPADSAGSDASSGSRYDAEAEAESVAEAGSRLGTGSGPTPRVGAADPAVGANPTAAPPAAPDAVDAGTNPTALLQAADRARTAGENERAAELLTQFVTDHPTDPQTSVAAFTLGRLALERLDDPKRAAEAFQRALDAGVPRALEEDAMARLVESYARAGDHAAADEAAGRYLDRFANGRRAAEVRRWVSR